MEVSDSKSLMADINVTPLVDVMLVMLIIFMLVTPMLQKGVSVSLPEARNVQAVSENEKQVAVVALLRNGELYLGRQPIDKAELLRELRARRQANPALQLQIKADEEVRFGEVRKLVVAGREAGFEEAALIAAELKISESSEPPRGG